MGLLAHGSWLPWGGVAQGLLHPGLSVVAFLTFTPPSSGPLRASLHTGAENEAWQMAPKASF